MFVNFIQKTNFLRVVHLFTLAFFSKKKQKTLSSLEQTTSTLMSCLTGCLKNTCFCFVPVDNSFNHSPSFPLKFPAAQTPSHVQTSLGDKSHTQGDEVVVRRWLAASDDCTEVISCRHPCMGERRPEKLYQNVSITVNTVAFVTLTPVAKRKFSVNLSTVKFLSVDWLKGIKMLLYCRWG